MKGVAIAAIAAMSMGMLTGCGGDKNQDGEKQSERDSGVACGGGDNN